MGDEMPTRIQTSICKRQRKCMPKPEGRPSRVWVRIADRSAGSNEAHRASHSRSAASTRPTFSELARGAHREQDSVRVRERAARPGIPIAGSRSSQAPEARLQLPESCVPKPRAESGTAPPLARYPDRALNRMSSPDRWGWEYRDSRLAAWQLLH